MHLPYVCKRRKSAAPFPSGSQEKGGTKDSSGGFKSAIQDSNSSLVLKPKSRSSANLLFFLCVPVGAPIARMGADVAFGIRVISRCIVHERTNAWDCACLRSAADGHPRRRYIIIVVVVVITITMTIRVNTFLLCRRRRRRSHQTWVDLR